jgi:hypothetical protein
MRHVICDACGQTLTLGKDALYTWSIVANPMMEPSPVDEVDVPNHDPDLDSIDEMDAMLVERGEDGDTVEMLPVCVQRHYEICSGCYGRLLADPLGTETRRAMRFSRN